MNGMANAKPKGRRGGRPLAQNWTGSLIARNEHVAPGRAYLSATFRNLSAIVLACPFVPRSGRRAQARRPGARHARRAGHRARQHGLFKEIAESHEFLDT